MKKVFYRYISLLLCFIITVSLMPAAVVYAEKDDYSSITEFEKKRIVVSLGDSYSSGEGIPDFYGYNRWNVSETIQSEDWLAHRSEHSWAGRLRLNGMSSGSDLSDYKRDLNQANPEDDFNWYFVASSGATTHHLEHKQRKVFYKEGMLDYLEELMLPVVDVASDIIEVASYKDLPPQIDIIKKLEVDNDIDYVTFTLGGNDAKFVDVIMAAAVKSTFLNTNNLTDLINQIWRVFYEGDKSSGSKWEHVSIRDRLLDVYKKISDETDADIIVAGYPKLIAPGNHFPLFCSEEVRIINEAVSNFNKAISYAVQQSYSEGVNVHFVSVEEAFGDNGAYSKSELINKVNLFAEEQDLIDSDTLLTIYYDEAKDKFNVNPNITSAYSMHPNDDGAQVYADCVQKMIDSLEEGREQEKLASVLGRSDEREIVLVLDNSGSMDGTPLAETKNASKLFFDTVLEQEASVGIVEFDSEAEKYTDFSKNKDYLKSVVNTMNAYGGTNIDDGLVKAEEMLDGSNAKKKIIVLMTDGMPNNGRTGDDLVEYANTLKEKGIYVYTLGFFSSLSDSERKSAQELLEQIASDGCHYEIDDADKIVYFFDDIANQINGQKYIYIRIACPVDVTVSFDGETLCSKESKLSTRTDFGTLSFEENDESTGGTKDNRTKILRLKEGVAYDVSIEGNGNGKMNYTIGFMDEDGEYKDSRKFTNVKITKDTVIDTVADYTEKTVLKVDEDGDGKYDITYEAGVNGRGEMIDNSYVIYILAISAGLIVLSVIALVIRSKFRKRSSNKKAAKQFN